MTKEKPERIYECPHCHKQIRSCFDVRITCKCGKQMVEIQGEKLEPRKS